MRPRIVYNGKLGALDTCYKIDDTSDRPQVTLYEQCPGPLGANCIGKALGFGTGKSVADALSDANANAIKNITDRDNPR